MMAPGASSSPHQLSDRREAERDRHATHGRPGFSVLRRREGQVPCIAVAQRVTGILRERLGVQAPRCLRPAALFPALHGSSKKTLKRYFSVHVAQSNLGIWPPKKPKR